MNAKIIKRSVVVCYECGSCIWSRWEGEFVICGCPNETFCDQTQYYERVGGRDLSKIGRDEMRLPPLYSLLKRHS